MKVEAGWGDQDSLKDLLDPFQGILGPGALNQNSSAVSRRSEKGKQNRRGLSLSMQAHDLLRLRVLPGLKWWILALHAALASLRTGRAASEQVWAAAGRLGRKGSLPARVSGSEYVFASLLIMPSWQIGISSLEKKEPHCTLGKLLL